MPKPARYNNLIIIRKDEIEALLAALKRENQEIGASRQQPQPLNPAAYNDYRWLIKAEESEDLERNP